MEKTTLDLDVGSAARRDINVKVEFLIDSGIVDSVIPETILRRLGIEPTREHEFQLQLADGSSIIRKKGKALFKYKDKTGVADVIFGKNGDCVILGSSTLKALGLALHPLQRKIMPI